MDTLTGGGGSNIAVVTARSFHGELGSIRGRGKNVLTLHSGQSTPVSNTYQGVKLRSGADITNA